ncbi:MAG: hypothetical protein NTV92_00205 [Candidatus Bipolaricaulota bacterium]|nr:hypothetical protein [Candidatus Bipolaricaulota bacterium]
MTQAFLIVVRVLLVALVRVWGFRLWVGTMSWTARGVGIFFSAVLVWQTVAGTL